ENLMLLLATLRAGAVYLPLNTAYTIAELDYFIGDAEPKLVVCDPARRDGVLPIAQAHNAAVDTLDAHGQGSLIDLARQSPAGFDDVARTDADIAVILYTSGTTGRSKGAMLTHRNLSSNAQVLADYWRFTPQDVLLHGLPIY